MQLAFKKYPFSPILGWSISRYETFCKCKRQYFYTYYSKFVTSIPVFKINQLKELTSVPLETGNVVHDVVEAFLKRLQQSDRDIDEKRFFEFARKLTTQYFAEKTFIEVYYGYQSELNMSTVSEKIDSCLRNFIGSSCYSWIFMAALHDKANWIIEPDGYGETRLDGRKVYCKMDFLLPVDDCIYILDWKTGRRDEVKHAAQLIGYSAAASSMFDIEWKRIFPRIVYLYPEFDEMELTIGNAEKEHFFTQIREQTEEMYRFCSDIEQNVPRDIDTFEKNPSPGLCRQCKFRELCFPDCMSNNNCEGITEF